MKIGLTTFGGGFAMIANLRDEIVLKKKWLTDDEITEMIAIGESTPGTIAINVATFVGYKRKKIIGGMVATLGFVIPSFIIILILSIFLDKIIHNQYVMYAFKGIKVAVGLLILRVGLQLISKQEKKLFPIILLIITLISCFLIQLFNLTFSSIFIILIGGIIGLIYYSINKNKEVSE